MAVATITDTFLDKPFLRKTDFNTALKAALVNAGFSNTDVDTFDITDAGAQTYNSFNSTTGSTFNSGNANSISGFVKSHILNAGATLGTVQLVFFNRGAWSTNYGGSGSGTNNTTDNAFCPGNYIVTGGWDTTNKKPTSTVDGSCIGGYVADYSAAITQAVSVADSRYAYSTGASGTSSRLPNGNPWQGAATTTDTTTFPYNYTNPIFFKAINHPEFRGVFIQQASRGTIFVGYIRPENLPTWWNENSYAYCFHSPNSDFLNFRSFSGVFSPYSGTNQQTSYRIGNLSLGSGNAANSSKRDVVSAPLLLDNQTQVGILGRFSNDVILTNYTTLTQFDKLIVTAGVEEYLILSQNRIARPPTTNTSTYGGNIDNTTYSVGVRIV